MKRIKKIANTATEVSLARLHATMQLIGALSPRSKSSSTIAQRAPCQLQLLGDPDRFGVEGLALELGEAI
jgi:hypothetical protein